MKKKRRSIRLQGYDYSQAGAYFVTICTQNRQCLFGNIVDGEMVLNEYGSVIRTCWVEIPVHFSETKLDLFVVMPNHVHGIVWLNGRGTACRAPTTGEQFGKPVSGSLPAMIRSFKSAVTKQINEMCNTPGAKLWQRNYYEHIIRNNNELNRIREYITHNPARWDMDRENPDVRARHVVLQGGYPL